MSKGETGCCEAITFAAKEARQENGELREHLRKVGAAFLSSREVSSQECVYRCFPELWLRKTFPSVIYVNTDLLERRIRTRKNEQLLAELDPDSTDIYNTNIIDRYCDRPNAKFMNSMYAQVNNFMSSREFAVYYYKSYRTIENENDNQPQILTNELLESQLQQPSTELPSKFKLMTREQTMHCRKVKSVIRYHKPNMITEPERYFHHLLIFSHGAENQNLLATMEHTHRSSVTL